MTASTPQRRTEKEPYGPRIPVEDIPEGEPLYHSDGLVTGRSAPDAHLKFPRRVTP